MRVAALGVSIVALALGGLAIYTFGWRGAGATNSERSRAVAYAQEAFAATPACDKRPCRILGLRQLAHDLWRIRVLVSGVAHCVDLNLDKYAVKGTNDIVGVTRAPCP